MTAEVDYLLVGAVLGLVVVGIFVGHAVSREPQKPPPQSGSRSVRVLQKPYDWQEHGE